MEHPYKTPEADLAEEKLTARGFLSGGQPLWKAFWLFFADCSASPPGRRWWPLSIR